MKTKIKTILEVQKKFARLTRLQKIETLFEALDFMQQYNGRSKWECIALVFNYSIND